MRCVDNLNFCLLLFQEVTKNYSRSIYKEDLPKIQRKLKAAEKESGAPETRKARGKAPSKGVKINFVHG